jgi:hypothetical protein
MGKGRSGNDHILRNQKEIFKELLNLRRDLLEWKK